MTFPSGTSAASDPGTSAASDRCLHSGLVDCQHTDCPPIRWACGCGYCDARRASILDTPTLDPRPRVPFPTVIGLGDLLAEVRADLLARRDAEGA